MAGTDELMLIELGRALASLGHELNNVVGVVQSYAAFIHEGSEDEAVIADAQVIRDSAAKAAQLARQMLAFGHPRESEPEPLELAPFLQDVAGFFRRTLGEQRAVEVEVEADAVALARRAELGRSLLLCCLEMHRAAPAGVALVLRCSRSGATIEVAVACGPEGVASGGVFSLPAASEGTLEPEPALGDAEGPAEARGTETVLVLEETSELRQALCRMLEAAGYRALEAEDEPTALGLGLEGGVPIDVLLTTSLPDGAARELFERLRTAHPRLCRLAQPKPIAAAELQRAVRSALDERIGRSHAALVDAERVLALVVDDDPHVRLALSRILDDCGADVVTVPSGLHALQKLASLPIDLVIADQTMPGMEGTRLLETVCRTWPRVARVVYTGYLSSALVIDAVNRANVHKVLAKDMSPESLRQHLSELIAEIRSTRSP